MVDQQTRQDPSVDTDGLLGQLGHLFGRHSDTPVQQPGEILPASQDPLGDPADQGGSILPASQDPLGDPADQR